MYHLEHYSNLVEYKDRNGAATPRKKNTPKLEGLKYTENSQSWGLTNYDLSLKPYAGNSFAKTHNYLSSIKIVIGIFLLIKDRALELLLSKAPSVKIFLGRLNPFK